MKDLFSVACPELREKLFLLKREILERDKLLERDRLLIDWRLGEAATLLSARGQEETQLLLPQEMRECFEAFVAALPPRQAPEYSRQLCLHLGKALFAAGKGSLSCPPHPADGEKLCYVRNRFSDAAYDLLHPYFDRSTALYADSFAEAAELLASEECDALLLPFETGEGEQLRGIRSLVTGYDFKKTAVCVLHDEQTGDSILFAVYRRQLFQSPAARYLEATLPDGDERAILDLLAFAALGGIEVHRATLQKREDGNSCRFLFRSDPAGLCALRVYFGLCYPHYSCDGIYDRISDGKEADASRESEEDGLL